MKTKFALAAVLLAAACGGGKSDIDAQLTRIDSRVVDGNGGADASTACAAEPTFNTTPPVDGTDSAAFSTDPTSGPTVQWQWGQAGTGVNPDLVLLFLPRPIPAGDQNTPLMLVQACTGDPIDYCMEMLTDVDDQGNFAQLLYPDTGTLTIAVNGAGGEVGDTLTLTMTDALFDHYDADTGMPIDDGCVSNSTAFPATDFVIQAGTLTGGNGPLVLRPAPRVHERQ